jgi:hypothetical protein
MKYWTRCCLILILACSIATAADKKFEIEVVSLYVFTTKDGIAEGYLAKIILPDGSHATASCDPLIAPCPIDDYPERLKHTSDTKGITYTGFSKLKATRKGKDLTIYTANGKSKYLITGSW